MLTKIVAYIAYTEKTSTKKTIKALFAAYAYMIVKKREK